MEKDNVLYEEYQYYLKNKDEFIKKYHNRYIIIKNKKVQGVYKTIK
jgi:hypothetical protein